MNIENQSYETKPIPAFSFSVRYPVKGVFKREKTASYEIRTLCINAMTKIASEAIKIDVSFIHEDTGTLDAAYKIASESGDSLLKIVAYAILNENREPDDKLIRILGYMTPNDLKNAFVAIVDRMDCPSFLTAIIAIGKVNVLGGVSQTNNE